MDVAGDADHIEHAVLGRDDLVLPVALAAGVGHGTEFQAGLLGGVVAHHAAHVLFLAVPPWAVLVVRKYLGVVLVADLHVVDAGLDAGLVDRLDLVVGKLGVVDQAAVADGAVQHLQFRPIGDPRGFFRCHRTCSHSTYGLVRRALLFPAQRVSSAIRRSVVVRQKSAEGTSINS